MFFKKSPLVFKELSKKVHGFNIICYSQQKKVHGFNMVVCYSQTF